MVMEERGWVSRERKTKKESEREREMKSERMKSERKMRSEGEMKRERSLRQGGFQKKEKGAEKRPKGADKRKRKEKKDMESEPHYVDCAFKYNNQARAFIFTSDQCVEINYEHNQILKGPMKICEFFPKLNNYFADGIDAAFTSAENEVYIFKKNKYTRLNFATGDIIQGPKEITEDFPFLKDNSFKNGIAAAFASSQPNEAYIFKGDQYAIINFKASTKEDFWVSPLKQFAVDFPYVQGSVFEEGVGSAFSADATNEAYIFKGDNCARISYAPGTSSTDDYIINGPMSIDDFIPSLGNTIFATRINVAFTSFLENEPLHPPDIMKPIYLGTVFEDGLDAAFSANATNEAYIFNYALGTTYDYTIKHVTPINDGFLSLRGIIPWYPLGC
ncbi:hypothetical protein LguiB_026528 [Lonicera macranthoides]